jgi:L-amino acid N-acyltransferase YncA
MEYRIVPMHSKHWPSVREIYAEGITTGNATFETELPDWKKWDGGHCENCRLVALERFEGSADLSLDNAKVLGWAALSPVSSRRVYAGVTEVSIYVAATGQGRGVGKALLEALVLESEAHGMWTLQAGIFPENGVSVRLHESCGFRAVGVRSRIGKLAGVWRDVLLLERRSAKVGR